MRKSDSFFLNAVLSFSGGLQDAYTYNVRGKVFANAQTGNVVLMSQNFMSGKWAAGVNYLVPIMSFVLGIAVADFIEHNHWKRSRLHWRQVVVFFEMFLLIGVGFIPAGYKMVPNMLVSFTCAMQVHSFRRVNGVKYASTMCIGNLTTATENLSEGVRSRDHRALSNALSLFGIIAFFAIGAGFGGILSGKIGVETIWISAALLIVAIVLMFQVRQEKKAEGDKS